MRAFPAPVLFVCLLLGAALGVAAAQDFTRIQAVHPLPNGIALESGSLRMIITALRPDVLRIRAGRDGHLPEDTSWAVLASARAATVPVEQESSATEAGFRTAALRLVVQRATGLLTVFDASGSVVLRQAAPLRFEGNAFRIAHLMPPDEHYFGLGDKTGGFDRRNHAFTLWNTDAYRFQEDTDPLYKSIPFFLTFRAGSAAGLLLDNTWRTSFDFGKQSPGRYTFGSVDGPVDYYILVGPAPRAVLESYAWLTGTPPLPPLWAFGYQQSRYTYTPASRLLQVATRLRQDHIPADALYLDIDFQDRNRPFTVDTQNFPDLPSVVAQLHRMHFHLVAITDLHIARAPGENYPPYDSGLAADAFLRNPDGSLYVGSVWPGPSVFPDFTRAQVRAWWGTLYEPFTRAGIDGYWNDMNEPSVFSEPTGTIPENVLHRIDEPGHAPRTATHAELHNVYGEQNARATYEGLLRVAPDLRPFVLTRAAYAGTQRYAVTWTGDNSSTWSHLRMTTFMLKNLGLSGFAYAGADAGGFAGTATSDLLTSWLAVSAFQPIDRNHTEKGTGDQEPWIGSPAAEDLRRGFIQTRYRLLPYIYTVAEEAARIGIPMERPLFLDYPAAARDRHPIDLDAGAEAEFLLGHDLLVAPSPYPEAPDAYTVEFPTAHWYDFWTGDAVPPPPPVAAPANAPPDATQLVPLATRITPSPGALPVFVRAGAILPLQPLVENTSQTPDGPLTLRVYAGDDCAGALYTDDGSTLAYQRGAYLRLRFACAVTPSGLTLQLSPHQGSYPAWWHTLRVEIYGWKPTQNTARLDNSTTPLTIENAGNHFVVLLPDNPSGQTLSLH